MATQTVSFIAQSSGERCRVHDAMGASSGGHYYCSLARHEREIEPIKGEARDSYGSSHGDH